MKGVIEIESIKLPFEQEYYDSLFKPRTEIEMEKIIHVDRVMERINPIRHPVILEDYVMSRIEFAKYCEEVGRNYMLNKKNFMSTIKGTLHARVKRGEDAKKRRRSYLLSKLQSFNQKKNAMRGAIYDALNPKIKPSLWRRFINFLKNLFKRRNPDPTVTGTI